MTDNNNSTGLFFDTRCLLHHANYNHVEGPRRVIKSYEKLVNSGLWNECKHLQLTGRSILDSLDSNNIKLLYGSSTPMLPDDIFNNSINNNNDNKSDISSSKSSIPLNKVPYKPLSSPDPFPHLGIGDIPPFAQSLNVTLTQEPLFNPIYPIPCGIITDIDLLSVHTREQISTVHSTLYEEYGPDEPDSETEGDDALYPGNTIIGDDGDTYGNLYSAPAAYTAASGLAHLTIAVCQGLITNAFCLARPPGHHAGLIPQYIIDELDNNIGFKDDTYRIVGKYGGKYDNNDKNKSNIGIQGFCLFNNIALSVRLAQKMFSEESIMTNNCNNIPLNDELSDLKDLHVKDDHYNQHNNQNDDDNKNNTINNNVSNRDNSLLSTFSTNEFIHVDDLSEQINTISLKTNNMIETSQNIIISSSLNNEFNISPSIDHDINISSSTNNSTESPSYHIGQYLAPVKRVAIIDFDVHHGNGTQNCFYYDNTVLYISIHRYTPGFFPQTGYYTDIGSGAGKGYTINIPLQSIQYTDIEYIIAFYRLIIPICESFQPDLVMISAGFDALQGDPLGEMLISPNCLAHITRALMSKYIVSRTNNNNNTNINSNNNANNINGNNQSRIIAVLEGGYNPDVVSEGVHSMISALKGYPLTPLYNPDHDIPSNMLRNILLKRKEFTTMLKECMKILVPYWPILQYQINDQSIWHMQDSNDIIQMWAKCRDYGFMSTGLGGKKTNNSNKKNRK